MFSIFCQRLKGLHSDEVVFDNNFSTPAFAALSLKNKIAKKQRTHHSHWRQVQQSPLVSYSAVGWLHVCE